MRVRFAPSPTGSLHLGNARTALFNWLAARRAGGVFVLRIEDTDTDRHREGSEQSILDDLRWLGLDWDEGPQVGGDYGPYEQSARGDVYASAAARLLEEHRAYRCFCDEAELAAERQRRVAEGRPPHYSGRCRSLDPGASAARANAGEPFTIRFRTAPREGAPEDAVVAFVDRLRGRVQFPLSEIGDTVMVRQDGRPTYNFAVVVDDAEMSIDLVLRGDDHLSNTPRQVLMFEALGRSTPEFVHLPMVRGPDGSRLSKRHGAVSVGEYARAGYPVEGMINALALLGWSPGGDRTVLTREELVADFDLDRIVRSPATFDPQKLEWICAQQIQRMPEETLLLRLGEALVEAGRLPAAWTPEIERWAVGLVPIVRNAISHFAEIPDRCAPVFFEGGRPDDPAARAILEESGAADVVAALAAEAARQPPADLERWQTIKRTVKEGSGKKGKALFRPLRVAITGLESGAELDSLVPTVERGSELLPDRIVPIATRARRTLAWLRDE